MYDATSLFNVEERGAGIFLKNSMIPHKDAGICLFDGRSMCVGEAVGY